MSSQRVLREGTRWEQALGLWVSAPALWAQKIQSFLEPQFHVIHWEKRQREQMVWPLRTLSNAQSHRSVLPQRGLLKLGIHGPHTAEQNLSFPHSHFLSVLDGPPHICLRLWRAQGSDGAVQVPLWGQATLLLKILHCLPNTFGMKSQCNSTVSQMLTTLPSQCIVPPFPVAHSTLASAAFWLILEHSTPYPT